jgi:hypothetical protein
MSHQHSKDWDLAEAKLRETRGEPTSMSMYRYSVGKKDCIEGRESCVDHEDYLRGYADQYAAEQTASAQSREELK